MSTTLAKNTRNNAGKIAIERVIKDRYNLDSFILTNPSMTNCPAKVPAIVEDCPEANNPIAQIYFPVNPKLSYKASPAVKAFKSSYFPRSVAKVAITVKLIRKEMKSEKADSMEKYLIAFETVCLWFLLIFRLSTNEECK